MARAFAKDWGAVQIGAGGYLNIGQAGMHNKDGGLLEQVQHVSLYTGRLVERIDSFGHGQSGFETTPDNSGVGWRMGGTAFGKMLKPYVTADVKLVFHGCEIRNNAKDTSGTNDADVGVKALLNQMRGATVYGHWDAAGPGMPLDWTKITRKADGDLNIEHNVSPILEGIQTARQVRAWAIQQKQTYATDVELAGEKSQSSLDYMLHDPKLRMSSDVRGIMNEVQHDTSVPGVAPRK